MELAKIEKLVDKYLEAETTLEEEKTLKEYFSKSDVPEHLLAYKDLFSYFKNSSLEKSNKKIIIPQRSVNLRWLSVAAVVIFFIGIYSVNQNNISEKEEARQAYMETQKALNLISQNLNKGNNAIAQLETFEKTQNKIFNNK